MTKPNLFIAGAQKSGTPTIYRMLEKHPDVFMPQHKELNFFNQSEITQNDFETYCKNFDGAQNQKYISEATPHYYNSNANGDGKSITADRIARFVGPDVTIMLLLRNPVERALAGWRHNFIHGKLDQSMSIFETPSSMGILQLSHYARHWDAWARVFSEKNIHVFLHDTLSAHPKFLLRDMLQKLQLPFDEAYYKNFSFDKPANEVVEKMQKNNVSILPGFERDVIERLVEMFNKDIVHVEKITGLNLDHWRDAGEISKRFYSIARAA